MINNYPNTLAVVEYHLSDSYSFSWGTSRANYYGVQYIPNLHLDGIVDCLYYHATYNSQFLSRQLVPTDITMDMVGEHVSGDVYSYKVHVCMEETGTARPMKIYMVQTLSNWPNDGYARNTFRQAASYETITLNPGECAVVEREFTITNPGGYDMDDVTIVAWAQATTGSPQEIYQGKTLQYPYEPYDDCNSNGTPDDWEEIDPCPGDLTHDCVTDIGDIFAVLGLWGPCEDPCPPYCEGDIDKNCTVDIGDIFAILGEWGSCY